VYRSFRIEIEKERSRESNEKIPKIGTLLDLNVS